MMAIQALGRQLRSLDLGEDGGDLRRDLVADLDRLGLADRDPRLGERLLDIAEHIFDRFGAQGSSLHRLLAGARIRST